MSTIESNASDDAGIDAIDGVEVRTLHTAAEMSVLGDVFRQVWGSVTPLLTIEILMAVSHSGGYVSAAFDTRGEDERMVGASVAILARHNGQPALHSHITGLLPGAQRTGLGRAMKLHQRDWAAAEGIDWIVWTFDPLVRRNAHFNIAVLGAEAHEYLPEFYGNMSDAINAGDESDRLLVAWPTDPSKLSPGRDGTAASPNARLIPTPPDIVALRRTDAAAVAQWRSDVRASLTEALDTGDRIAGFTAAGEYVIEPSA